MIRRIESLTVGARARAKAGTTRRTRRLILVPGQLAVAIAVQLLERRHGVRDLFGVDHAVMIRVERGEQRRKHRAARSHARSTLRSARLSALWPGLRSAVWSRLRTALRRAGRWALLSAEFARRVSRAWRPLAIRAVGRPHHPAGAARRTGAEEFVAGQFAVAIDVQFLERGDGVRDFIGIDDAVMIGVERGDDRRHGRSREARRGLIVLLGERAERGPSQGERGHE